MNKEELKKLLKDNLKIRFDCKNENVLVNRELNWTIKQCIVTCVIEFDGEDICNTIFKIDKK